jgi:hypothetical protein
VKESEELGFKTFPNPTLEREAKRHITVLVRELFPRFAFKKTINITDRSTMGDIHYRILNNNKIPLHQHCTLFSLYIGKSLSHMGLDQHISAFNIYKDDVFYYRFISTDSSEYEEKIASIENIITEKKYFSKPKEFIDHINSLHSYVKNDLESIEKVVNFHSGTREDYYKEKKALWRDIKVRHQILLNFNEHAKGIEKYTGAAPKELIHQLFHKKIEKAFHELKGKYLNCYSHISTYL